MSVRLRKSANAWRIGTMWTFTCPLMTGIFLRIVAEAAEEDRLLGKCDITPYWRIVGEDGKLNAKFPGGVERQAEHLREEGHAVEHGKVAIRRTAAPAA